MCGVYVCIYQGLNQNTEIASDINKKRHLNVQHAPFKRFFKPFTAG